MKNFLDLLKILGKRTALSHLIPGIVVSWLLLRPIQNIVSQTSVSNLVVIPDSEIVLWVAFFIFAWIVGSILKLIGSLLDRPVYDWFFKQIVKRGQNELLEKAKEMIHKDLGDDVDWDKFDYFNYSVTYVKTEGVEEGIKEIDEYIGNSKLFRSLAVTLVGVSGTLIILGQRGLAIGAFAFSLLALWMFCADRWLSTQRAYEYYINTRPNKGRKPRHNKPNP